MGTESIDRMLGAGVGNQCLAGTDFQLEEIKNLWRWMVVMLAQQVECT